MFSKTKITLTLFFISSALLANEFEGIRFDPHSTFDVLDYQTNKSRRINARGTRFQFEILANRGRTYEIALFDNGKRVNRRYFVAKKWAHRAANIQAIKQLDILNTELQASPTKPLTSEECDHCGINHQGNVPTPPSKPTIVPAPTPRPKARPRIDIVAGNRIAKGLQVDVSPTACQHFKTFVASGVPKKPLQQALKFYSKNKSKFSGDWISIADYSQRSTNKRFYMVNIRTGQVRKEKVSHGSGHQGGVKRGDSNHDGHLDKCHSKGNRTNMTRPGFFKTAELYVSTKHKRIRNGQLEWPNLSSRGHNGLRMDGLTPGINDHARRRGVVMHGAWYNGGKIMGRSYGCPAFTSAKAPEIINRIKGGNLYYSYTPQCADDQRKVEKQVKGWGNMCDAYDK